MIEVGKLNSHTGIFIPLLLFLFLILLLFCNRERILVEDMFRQKFGGSLPVIHRLLEPPVFNVAE
jgi:hypothetical protein